MKMERALPQLEYLVDGVQNDLPLYQALFGMNQNTNLPSSEKEASNSGVWRFGWIYSS